MSAEEPPQQPPTSLSNKSFGGFAPKDGKRFPGFSPPKNESPHDLLGPPHEAVMRTIQRRPNPVLRGTTTSASGGSKSSGDSAAATPNSQTTTPAPTMVVDVFPSDVIRLVGAIRTNLDGAALSTPAIVQVCEALIPSRAVGFSSSSLTTEASRLKTFISALATMNQDEAYSFVQRGGYGLLLHLSRLPSFGSVSEMHSAFTAVLFTRTGDLESIWATMRAGFFPLRRSAEARAIFLRDVAYLGQHGLQPETILNLAMEAPMLIAECGQVLIQMHDAYTTQQEPARRILACLARLGVLSLDWSADTLMNSKHLAVYGQMISDHLVKFLEPLTQIEDLTEFVVSVVRATAGKLLGGVDRSWICRLLEVALGRSDGLGAAVRQALMREDVVFTFASTNAALDVARFQGVAEKLLELLLCAYLPLDGESLGERVCSLSRQATGPVGQMLLNWSRTTDVAAHLAIVHLLLTNSQRTVRMGESPWNDSEHLRLPGKALLHSVDEVVKGELHRYNGPRFSSLNTNVTANPLIFPVMLNKLDSCSLLLQCGWSPYAEITDLRQSQSSMRSAFVTAAENGDWEIVRLFLEHLPTTVNDLYRTNMTYDGDPHLRMTLLTILAYMERVEFMKLLLSVHPDVRTHKPASGEQMTPLHAAAISGSVPAVELLISHGANPREIELAGSINSPLFCALKEGNENAARRLIAHGAPTRNVTTKSILEDCLYVAFTMEQYDMMELMLASGADPNEQSRKSRIPALRDSQQRHIITHALAEGNARVVRLLLDYGAELRLPQSAAPFWATQNCDDSNPAEIVRTLIAHGLPWDEDYRDDTGLYLPSAITLLADDPAVTSSESIADILLSYRYLNAEILVTEDGQPMARYLFKRWLKSRPKDQLYGGDKRCLLMAQLLLDYGGPTGPRENNEYDLCDCVASPKEPTGAQLFKINNKLVRYIPWKHELHRFTPGAFRKATYALLLLRECRPPHTTVGPSGSQLAVDPALPSVWESLPLEVFELVVEALYQMSRADYAPLPHPGPPKTPATGVTEATP